MRIRDVSIPLVSAALGGATVFYLAAPGNAGEPQDMPPVLAEGMRAVSVSVDSLPGDAPNVRSGDRVDILLTRDVGGQLVSKVILQDITVIAVSKQEDIGAGSPVVEQSDRKAMERLEAALLVG